MGRLVANFEFLTALLKNGSFDEYYFFSPDVGLQKLMVKKLESIGLPDDVKSKLKFLLYFDLKIALSKLDFHVFHLGGFGYFMPGLAYIRNNYAKNQFPITGIIHSLNGFESPYHFLKLSKAPFYPSDSLICSSDAGRKVVENYLAQTNQHFNCRFPGVLKRIPLGIDASHFQPGSRTEARSKLGWDANTIYLLSIGRFSPYVKADYGPLFVCLKRIIEKNPTLPVKAVLAGGNDPAVPVVRDMVREFGLVNHVEMRVDFDDPEKNLLYDAADVYFSISDNNQETFGLSVVEAMAHRLPCVVTDFNGYRERIIHGEEGYRIRTIGMKKNHTLKDISEVMNFNSVQLMNAQGVTLDLEALEDAFISLITSSEKRQALGTAARKRAEEYSWPVIIRAYESHWETLFQNSREQKPAPVMTNPFEINYGKIFEHYTTEHLLPDSALEITKEGSDIIAGTAAIPGKYADMHSILVEEFIILVLKMLKERPASLSVLIRSVSKNQVSIEQSLLEVHLLWMAKYGLIRITNDE